MDLVLKQKLESSGLIITDPNVKAVLDAAVNTISQLKEWQAKAKEIQVLDHTDKKGMKAAGDIRKEVKREKSGGKKFVDAKRKEVQALMQKYKVEDTAWLKIQQYIDEEASKIEDALAEKENTLKRYEEEQLKLLTEKRVSELQKLVEDASLYPVGSMTEDAFNNLIDALKAKKIADEKAEEERIKRQAQEERDREELEEFNKKISELKAYEFIDGCKEVIGTLTKDNYRESFDNVLKQVKVLKANKDEEDLKTRKAAEKAKFEKEEAERKQKRAQMRQNEILSLGFTWQNKMFNLEYKNFKPVQITPEDLLKFSDEEYKLVMAPVTAILNEKQKEADTLAKKEVEKQELIKEDPNNILKIWIEDFVIPEFSETKNADIEVKRKQIISKFTGFKKWASSL